MDYKDFIKLAKKRYITIISFVLVFLIFALIITLIQPLKYRSKSRLLITQPNIAADAYAVARSNQYLGGLISEIVYSGSFLETLLSSDAVFDRNYFEGNYKQSLKKWKKSIFARSQGDSGVIQIEIYHTDPNEARNISLAVNDIIMSKDGPYQFNNRQVIISTIDQPIISSLPVKPNIPLNLIAGLIFGTVLGFSYVYAFPESQSAKILTRRRARKIYSEALYKEPFYTNAVYQADEKKINPKPISKKPPVPSNLPVYAYEEREEDVMEEPEEKQAWVNNNQAFSFRGNINNVLGE